MVSPRQDWWSVSAKKPKDTAGFDSAVRQPLQDFSTSIGQDVNDIVFEVFATEEEATWFAEEIQSLGATRVSINRPKETPRPRSISRGRPTFLDL
jgi:hypothetical protein